MYRTVRDCLHSAVTGVLFSSFQRWGSGCSCTVHCCVLKPQAASCTWYVVHSVFSRRVAVIYGALTGVHGLSGCKGKGSDCIQCWAHSWSSVSICGVSSCWVNQNYLRLILLTLSLLKQGFVGFTIQRIRMYQHMMCHIIPEVVYLIWPLLPIKMTFHKMIGIECSWDSLC